MKKEFTPFKVTCNLSNNQINNIRWRYNYSRKNIRNALKEQKRIAKLLKYSAHKDSDVTIEAFNGMQQRRIKITEKE